MRKIVRSRHSCNRNPAIGTGYAQNKTRAAATAELRPQLATGSYCRKKPGSSNRVCEMRGQCTAIVSADVGLVDSYGTGRT